MQCSLIVGPPLSSHTDVSASQECEMAFTIDTSSSDSDDCTDEDDSDDEFDPADEIEDTRPDCNPARAVLVGEYLGTPPFRSLILPSDIQHRKRRVKFHAILRYEELIAHSQVV